MNGKSAMENTYKYKYKQNTYRRNTSSCKFKVNIVVCCWDQVKNTAKKYYKSSIASISLPFKVRRAAKGACSPTHSSRSSSCPTICCKMATETSLTEVNSSTIRCDLFLQVLPLWWSVEVQSSGRESCINKSNWLYIYWYWK